ncbi:tRNA lysidine(34) synthetase TilS [Candidatus Saccharibacteria bacterium]|nr:tRNA lysidine(34) synthetase TilS [Candidatus Saccharibacteria bacterium]
MKKILAVSGGIDSVVMLHMFRNDPDVIVAHFDHGIRPNSSDDCDFVEKIAKSYNRPFFARHAKLGEDCPEDTARRARYDFLTKLAKEQNGQIYTAHHRDDLIESVAINLIRGTGWRGLAPLNNPSIVRPLLDMTKKDIYRYAAEHNLRFRQDQSNSDDSYLRNRIRFALRDVPDAQKEKLANLAMAQRRLAVEVDDILNSLNLNSNYPRSLFSQDDQVSIEILRFCLIQNDVQLTRPQLARALEAIRTFAQGKKYSLDKNHFLKINRYYFGVTTEIC